MNRLKILHDICPVRLKWVGCLTLLAALAAGCGKTAVPEVAKTTTPVAPTAPVVTIRAVAPESPDTSDARPSAKAVPAAAWNTKTCLDRVTAKVGEVRGRSGTDGQVPVFVFEEYHTSKAGQIEIAIMMLRLYTEYGLRHIALEGYLEGTTVSAKWFHEDKATDSRQRQVALQLLEQGEISNAEFLAMVFPDVKLHAIETKEHYHVKLEGAAASAPTMYLMLIAAKSINPRNLSAAQVAELQRLQKDPKKVREYVDFVLGLDPWTAKRHKAMQLEGKTISLEDLLPTYQEIEKRAAEVKAEIPEAQRKGMHDLIHFFESRHAASDTMVDRTAAVTKRAPKAPSAMIIGAAHSKRVCELLEKQMQPYVLISPNNLRGSDKSNLSMAAFDRKGHKKSIDEEGALGALIDGRDPTKRKKPESVLNELWLQAKTQLAVLSARVAEAAGKIGAPQPAGDPPFGLSEADLSRPQVRINRGTIQRAGNDVLFQVVMFPDEPNARRELWMRAAYVGRKQEAGGAIDISRVESLEEMLLSSRDRVVAGQSVKEAVDQKMATERDSTRPSEKALEPGKTDPPVIRVTADVIGQIATNKDALKAALTSG